MLETILQVTYRANWGLALIVAIIAAIALYITVVFFNRLLPERSQIPQEIYAKSSAISTIIVFGIIVGIRELFQLLGYWVIIFRYLNTDLLFFALMITLFYPFLKIFIDKFNERRNSKAAIKIGEGAKILSQEELGEFIESFDEKVGTQILTTTKKLKDKEARETIKETFFGVDSQYYIAPESIFVPTALLKTIEDIIKVENIQVPDLLEKKRVYNHKGPTIVGHQYKKFFRLFTYALWIIGVLFLYIPPLEPSPPHDIDIFYLGFLWIFAAVLIDTVIISLFNRTRSQEKRLPKTVLRPAEITGILVASGVWSVQLFVFEIYLKRFFGINLFEQDIRVLFGVVSLIYFIVVYLSLKYKFLPDAMKQSQEKVDRVLSLVKEKELTIKEIDRSNVVLEVNDLTTYFYTEEGVVKAVEGVSFQIFQGETLGLVGETGCGKSVTALSILQVVRPPGNIEKGKVFFSGEDLLQKSDLEMAKYRGKEITMIFQDPLNSINPVFKIGDQIAEVFLLHMENELLIEASQHHDKSIYSVAREWSQDLLRNLNIPFPEVIFDRYPHELSGGMRQRVQIAMGLACGPKLLIADEPTTALDVTIQNQILKLMKELKQKFDTSILFITHDLGIISKMCDRVAVMYSGYIVEYGELEQLFTNPYHPYTKGLIASIPVVGKKRERLEVIRGMVPNLIYPPSGCRFHPRCKYCFEPCDSNVPASMEVEPNYFVACHLYDPQYELQAKRSIENAEKNDFM